MAPTEWVIVFATVSLASAAIGAILQYCRDAIHYGHIHHPKEKPR